MQLLHLYLVQLFHIPGVFHREKFCVQFCYELLFSPPTPSNLVLRTLVTFFIVRSFICLFIFCSFNRSFIFGTHRAPFVYTFQSYSFGSVHFIVSAVTLSLCLSVCQLPSKFCRTTEVIYHRVTTIFDFFFKFSAVCLI